MKNLDELMKYLFETTRDPLSTANVPLKEADETQSVRCQVVRSKIGTLGIWSDVYGLEIDKKLIRVGVMYHEDPKTNDVVRRTTLDILSSITLLKDPIHKSGAKN